MRTRSKADGLASKKATTKIKAKSNTVYYNQDGQPSAPHQNAVAELVVGPKERHGTEWHGAGAGSPALDEEAPPINNLNETLAVIDNKAVQGLESGFNQVDPIDVSVCEMNIVGNGTGTYNMDEAPSVEVMEMPPVSVEEKMHVIEQVPLVEGSADMAAPASMEAAQEIIELSTSTLISGIVLVGSIDDTELMAEADTETSAAASAVDVDSKDAKESPVADAAFESSIEGFRVFGECNGEISAVGAFVRGNLGVREIGVTECETSAVTLKGGKKEELTISGVEVMSEVPQVEGEKEVVQQQTSGNGKEGGTVANNVEKEVEADDATWRNKDMEADCSAKHGGDASAEEAAEEGVQSEEDRSGQQLLSIFKRERWKRLEVFVGGLERDATEDDIKEVFKAAGEVTEVRLMKNPWTGKNKGFAFVRYSTMEEAKRAVSELDQANVLGKPCGVLLSDENNTLFLGNINRTWKKEAVMEKLTGYGFENVEKITLMMDSQNEGLNRGFAFVEFSTHKDALKAFKYLQLPDAIFGAERSAIVSWAQPLNEPDEAAMAQVKSVFLDGMPPEWDEEKVKEQFGTYGEIERVVLAKNIMSAKRKDFGFVNFATREAALACIAALNNSQLAAAGDTKVKIKVSLAKPQRKSKPFKSGVHGGYPPQASGSKPAGESRHGFSFALRGRRGAGRCGKGTRHQALQSTSYSGRAQGGFAVTVRNASRAHQSHHQLIHASVRDARPIGPGGGFGDVYGGRAGYTMTLLCGRPKESFQSQDPGQPGSSSGHNHGGASAVVGVCEHGAATIGIKRPFCAVDNSRYADASLRNACARVEPSVAAAGCSPDVAGSFHSRHLHRVPAKHSAQLVLRGGGTGLPGNTYYFGSHHRAYPAGNHGRDPEMVFDAAVYGAPVTTAGTYTGTYTTQRNCSGAYH